MRFAYYIPGVAHNEATETKLVELGLGERFRDCFHRVAHQFIACSQIHNNGPDGGSGAWIYPKGAEEQLPLTWKAANNWNAEPSDNGRFWVCWQKDAASDPEQLKRRKVVEGCDVELLDGKVWHCPTIRKALAIPNVPCSYQRKNGEIQRQVVPAYRSLWELSGAWAAEYYGSGLDEGQLVDIATTCLAVNYRVGDEELRLLGLLDYDGMKRILEVAIDLDFLKAASLDQKKSIPSDGQAESAESSPGAAA